MKCSICDTKVKDSYLGDIGTLYEGKPLCETCYYEDEPAATVFYSRDREPRAISGTRNETDGDFTAHWHRTDPWRGYYEVKSEKYSLVNSAELLAWHESELMLEKFDKRIKELFGDHDIEYARVFARSSNVFYNNYELFVDKTQEFSARLLVAKAKHEVDYHNPKWYKNILFDEASLNKLAELFPEREIKTDHDAYKLIEDLDEEALSEMKGRLKKSGDSNSSGL